MGKCCCGSSLTPALRQPPRTVGCDKCRDQRVEWQNSGEWKKYSKDREAIYEREEAERPRVYVGIPRIVTKAELEEIEAGHEAEQREKAEKEAVQGRTSDSGERTSPQVKAPKLLPIPKPNFEIRSGPQLEQGEEEDPYARPNRAARRHRVLLNRMAQGVVPIPEEDEDDASEELSSYSSTSSSSAGTVVRRLFVKHGDTSDPGSRSAPSAPKESGQETNGEPSSIRNGASAEDSSPSAGMIGYDALHVGRGPASYLPAHLAPTFGRPLPQPPIQKSEEEEDPMDDIYD